MRVNRYRVSIAAPRFWQAALLTAVGTIGVSSQTEAAIYYWPDSEPGFSRPALIAPQRRQKTRHQAKKSEIADKESAKPQGPLVISISIAQQRLRIYDANGFYAETPVSTGMPGHPTPMGVFSVIQKHKFHHSNIYSGAPMPYMQRITWSGVAMHAGVLPGHPASHGCIRMPMAFAIKMWNWTKMGARVVITPGDVSPASFVHPLLSTLKVPPQPAAVEEPKPEVPTAPKIDKAADVETSTKPAVAETKIDLRSTIGHGDSAKPAPDEASVSAPSQTRTADASNTSPTASPPVTMSDAAPAGGGVAPEAKQAISEKRNELASFDNKSAYDRPAEAANGETAKVEAAKVEGPKVEADAKAVAAPAAIPEPKKDQTRPSGAARASKVDPATAPKRTGQIAVFVSRKDSKLYVRQNFSPLFDVPVTIAQDERPLGTHIFTARVDKDDANVLHWSVVSLPAPTRYADRRGEDERNSRRRKTSGARPIEVKPLPVPDSAAEALDRLSLPADVMARIYEALSTGGSIIVSDQGITAGETGEGTDFIVSLR
jgi:lipoprotein-anchoring transpeptidase ErfK/SrfK